MNVSWRQPALLMLLLTLVGCGGGPRTEREQGKNLPVPLTVVYDTEISGQVLGKRISSPIGVDVDRRGVLYAVDAGNHRLIRFNPDLDPLRDMGGYGSQQGLFGEPSYVTVDNDLNVWVSDPGNRRISRHDSYLNYVDEIDLRDDDDPLKFAHPSGIALTNFGEVWLCDRDNNRLALFDNIGIFDRFVGEFGYSGGGLRDPGKIVAVDGEQFFVCDAGNSRVVVYDEYGNFSYAIEDPAFVAPQSLTFDEQGRVWILDIDTGLLFCFGPDGRFLLSVGPTIPGTDKALKAPSDLAFGADGRLIISDTGNHRLLVCRVAYENR